MKNIRKLFLIGFIVTLATPNLPAMIDDEEETKQTPESAVMMAAGQSIGASVTPQIPDYEITFTNSIDVAASLLAEKMLNLNQYEIITYLNNIILKPQSLTEACIGNLISSSINILNHPQIIMLINESNRAAGITILLAALMSENQKLAAILIGSGININIPFTGSLLHPQINRSLKLGTTPLHLAVTKGYDNLVRLLIEKGADITAITTSLNPRHYGLTALDQARQQQNQAIITILEEAYKESGLPIPAVVPPTVGRVIDFSNL